MINTEGVVCVVGGRRIRESLQQAREHAAAIGPDVSRGYTEEIEHFAWCIRNPDPKHLPRCHGVVAMGDAVIALTANIAAREGRRVEFKEAWFDPDKDETPEKDLAAKSA